MKPFKSPKQMLDAHEAMFGEAGRFAAETALAWARKLFAVPVDPLSVRIILAPVEMGPYNRHTGYCFDGAEEQTFILGNRHHCKFSDGEIALLSRERLVDLIVHELTHTRQATLLREHAGEWGWSQTGGNVHRDKGWYQAISEAAPNYLGVELPEDVWPRRNNPDTLTEPEMSHWPESIRALVKAKDPRLSKLAEAA
jgi:hypothetical protein